MANFLDKIRDAEFSRRQFLKGAAAATAAVTGLGMGAYADENTLAETAAPVEHSPIVNPEEGGKWVSAACWHNCGGQCMNKVMVKDGVVVRQKTDDTHPDSYEYPQQRACAKGRAQQKQCFGADRIKYPMKRKHWEPLTGGDRELRGQDEWERITWDEAYKYVADEYRNIIEKYGSSAILVPGWLSMGEVPVLNYLGGHVSTWDSCSYGSYVQDCGMYGMSGGDDSGNDRMDMTNAEYVVLVGANPAWTGLGTPALALSHAVSNGTKLVVVGPSCNATAKAMDAKWIPCRPGTDTALMLGIAYEMIRQDVVDYDFLNKYTLGFDADHMPEDVELKENYKDYLMGEYDGIVKDAAWASAITGVSEEDIAYLATVLGKDNKTWFIHGYAPARINGGENFPQGFMTVGLMGGHVGKPGHAVSAASEGGSFNTGASLVNSGSTGVSTPDNPIDDEIAAPDVWDAVLSGHYTHVGDGWIGYRDGGERDIDIHMVDFEFEGNFLQTGPNMTKGIEAIRKMDCVIARGMYLTTGCRYADIILPITTRWEREGGFSKSQREWLNVYSRVTEPLYEAKSDQEIDKGLMEALGYDPAELYQISEKAQFFNQILGCTVINEAGDGYEPLVTVTQEDIDEWGVAEELTAAGMEPMPQEGRISVNDFIAQGGYQVPRAEGDNYGHIGYAEFVADPEANPLPSASGKFEICCQAKVDTFNMLRINAGKEIKPYANYFVPETGYEHTFKDNDISGEKGEYPYIVYNPHYIGRSHSVFDNNVWLRDTFSDPVFISRADAAEKGIETGDTVLIYNQYGKIVRRASVVSSMIPGVIGIPHGSNVNMDEANQIDRGGADNILIGTPSNGFAVSGYNNNNCNFEKYTGEALAERRDIPVAMAE